MADAAFKPEKDYSKEADKQIPEAESLAKVRMAIYCIAHVVGKADTLDDCRPTSKLLLKSSPCLRSRPDR